MVRFSPVTLFPEMFNVLREEGVIARGIRQNLIAIEPVFLRDFAPLPHRHVDDHPAGGGDGMVIRPDIAAAAIESVLTPESVVVHVTPTGKIFTAEHARALAKHSHLVFLCGRYAGFDHRVVEKHATLELSLGDFVLSGGELPTMCMIDSIARFIPGVLGNPDSAVCDSFEDGLLEAPPFTKPNVWEGRAIPDVLLGGDHGAIARHRRKEQLRLTARNRPDLIQALWETLTRSEKAVVEKVWRSDSGFRPKPRA